MSNILTPQAQKRVWAMYRARLVLVTTLALLVLAIFAAIVLLPSYVALSLAAPPVSSPSQTQSNLEQDAAAVARAQALVREVGPLISSTSSPSMHIRKAVEARPKGITILTINFTPSQISLAGAGSREAVSAYRDALVKSGLYASVSVPVGALVGSGSGRFSIVINGSFK